jgi:hypothetical protein
MIRMGAAIALLLAVLPTDAATAKADYQRRADPYNRYISFSEVPESKREKVIAAVKFAVPSASRNTLLDRQIPEQVGTSRVYRINLDSLEWDWRVYAKLTQREPYGYEYNALVIRGDWLLHELSDTTESTAYYDLLYSKPPKTRDEFLAIWGVDQKQQAGLEVGWIETQSQVSKQGTRFIRRFLSNRGSVWVTQDVLKIERGTDPLEFPDGVFKHDGEESIALTPKVSTRLRTRGSAMAFLLSNGQGKRVEEAPVDLVDDSFKTIRSQAAIITPGSCVGCHVGGLNPPSVNGIESLLLQGVQFYSKDKDKQELAERFHLATKGLETELKRANEDFATFVFACNGLTPQQNAVGYREALRDYESDLTLERAAYELGATEAELRNALAYATAARIDLGPRFSVLAHGQAVPRTVYQEGYQKAYALLKAWRSN